MTVDLAVYEASIDETLVFRLTGKALVKTDVPKEIQIGDQVYPLRSYATCAQDGTIEFRLRLKERPSILAAKIGKQTFALTSRLSPIAAFQFADATVARLPDIARSLINKEPQPVILVTTRHASMPLTHWLPIADAAMALRQAGLRVILVHYGATGDFEQSITGFLGVADVAHHVARPQTRSSEAEPWDILRNDRDLRDALSTLVAFDEPVLVVACETTVLSATAHLAGRRRAVLVDRIAINAPRRVAAPIARKKLTDGINAALHGVTLVAPSADLQVAAGQQFPGAQVVTLPLGLGVLSELARNRRTPEDAIVTFGAAAGDLVKELINDGPDSTIHLDAQTSLIDLQRALGASRAVVASSDGGAPAIFAAQAARTLNLPLSTDIRSDIEIDSAFCSSVPVAIDELKSSLTLQPKTQRLEIRSVARAFTARLEVQDAVNILLHSYDVAKPTHLNRMQAFMIRALATRYRETVAKYGRLGILLGTDYIGDIGLIRAAETIVGKDAVFVEHRPRPQDRTRGLRGIDEALRLGISTVLIAKADAASCQLTMQRVANFGVESLPLMPQASNEDIAALEALAGYAAGSTAYLGDDRPPPQSDLTLLVGDGRIDADVIELDGADDGRRGKLATLFDATDLRFWTRPAPPAIGYNRLPGQRTRILDASISVNHRFDLMLAMARHLGCRRVIIDEKHRGDRMLAERLTYLPGITVAWLQSSSAITLAAPTAGKRRRRQ